MKLRNCWFLVAPLMILGAPRASVDAAVIAYSHTTTSQVAPFNDTFTLPGFNPALGTLTGVTITLSESINGQVSIFNSSATPVGFTNAFVSVPVTLSNSNGNLASVTATANLASGIAQPGFNTFSGLTSTNSVTTNVSTANLAQYIGGVVPLQFNLMFQGAQAGGTMDSNAMGILFFGGSASAGGITTITYAYQPSAAVPEPASLALVGLGLSTAGLVARRRSA